MADVNWAAVGLSVLSGGAAGALINNAFVGFRSRKQAISYRAEIIPVFTGELLTAESAISGSLTLFNPLVTQGVTTIPNLWIAKLEVWNSGNKDFPRFAFGVTLLQGATALHCLAPSSDRHHRTELSTTLLPSCPCAEADFEFFAFNRGDARTLTLYVVADGGNLDPSCLELSSSEPVVFRNVEVQTRQFLEAVIKSGVPFFSTYARFVKLLIQD